MKVWYHVHTYDRGNMWESIVGPRFKSRSAAIRWVYEHLEEVTYVAKWEIKEHTL